MTLTLTGNSAWVACKEQSRVIRVDTRTGKTLKSIRLGSPVIAVASGFNSIWALWSSSTLYRINRTTAKLVRSVRLPVAARDAMVVGDKLRSVLSGEPVALAGSGIPLTASIGVAVWDEHMVGSASLYSAADRALYRAKELGRNRTELFAS